MRQELGVDTLAFQTIEGLVEATGKDKTQFCLGCFNNEYPTPVPKDYDSGEVRKRMVDMSTEAYDNTEFKIST